MTDKEEYERRKANKQTAVENKYSERWWVKFKDPLSIFTFVLAVATIVLTWVAILQKWTLDRTDETARAGQRAFVFPKQEGNNWTTGRKDGEEVRRSFAVVWENSGNSPTREMTVSLWCPRPNVFNQVDPVTAGTKPEVSGAGRLLGPKQSIWGGVCNYSSTELQNFKDKKPPWFIAAETTYYDIFGKWHLTEYCIQIINLDGDFKNAGVNPTADTFGCETHNCADDECPDYKKRRPATSEP